MFFQEKNGSITVETGIILPVFLTFVVIIFECTRYFFVSTQLEDILQKVSWKAQIYENRDIHANMETIAREYIFVDPAKLRVSALSAPNLEAIVRAPRPGLGGQGDVVRYELSYAYRFFGIFDDKAWAPATLRLVAFNKNEYLL